MTLPWESAPEAISAQKTARFWSVKRRGRPTGPPLRVMNNATEGIVDFAARRAITRSVHRDGGIARRLAKRWIADIPIYILFDGPSMSGCLLGRWQEPYPKWPSGLPRKPLGLTLLDLIRTESVIDAVEKRHEEVRGELTINYALKLNVDRIAWPQADRSPAAAMDDSRLARLAIKTVPDPRPKGVLQAEVWINELGRLVRFGVCGLPDDHSKHAKAPWTTTELWDFGVPPRLENWQNQPVIDPATFQFPESERAMIRLANGADAQ